MSALSEEIMKKKSVALLIVFLLFAFAAVPTGAQTTPGAHRSVATVEDLPIPIPYPPAPGPSPMPPSGPPAPYPEPIIIIVD